MGIMVARGEDNALGRPINREVAFAGQRVKQKITFGLTLTLIIPLLVLTYGFYAYVLPMTQSGKASGDLFSIMALLGFTGLLMLGGGVVVWDVATAISRAARLITSSPSLEREALPDRRDDIGALLKAFAEMTATIERQADELRRVPARLDELARQAFRDSLTKLANRALFMDRLGHALSRNARRVDCLAVLFLDLDRFKVVNDSLGHDVGDRLLVEVGQRLKNCLRPEDTVARLGGDEFGLMLEGLAGMAAATQVAERIIAQFEQPFVVNQRQVFITSSIGIALSPSSVIQPEQLLRQADLAMYQAKTKGKGKYAVYDGSSTGPAMERLNLEMDLRGALLRNEFTLYYQPIIDLATNRIVRLEALIRWSHPARGLLLPVDFLALAEDTGLIMPIGRWVLGEACRQAYQWQRLVPPEAPLTVAVNLSATQLRQPALVREVMDAMDASGLPPSCLELEITEHVMMDDDPSIMPKLQALRDLGVHLALDDFGTGYSALNYLKRFPADALKIDRSFVHGIGDRAEDTAIVQAVITVAKSLRLRVDAEGIETAEQAAELRSLGCDCGQGFYFARPLPPEAVPALFSDPRWSAGLEPSRSARARLRLA